MSFIKTTPIADYSLTKPTITHVFKCENISNKVITIQTSSRSCGCTEVDYPARIEPGPFEIKMTMTKSDDFTGFFAVESKIKFSDGMTEEWVTFALTGQVRPSN